MEIIEVDIEDKKRGGQKYDSVAKCGIASGF